MKIEAFEYCGEGLQRVYENEKWTVGIKNWKPGNDVAAIDCLERHNETDELFVLLAGRCTLIYANEEAGGLHIEAVKMEPYRVYNIPRTLWHNTITSKDAKLALIEDVSTGMQNSDTLPLPEEQVKKMRMLAE